MSENIIAVVDDLFFASKIRGTAAELGVTVRFARSVDGVLESSRSDPPILIICDLHSRKVNPMEVAKKLKEDEQLRSLPLLGFYSHLQVELQRQAEAAGFDQVMARSAFSKNLSAILSAD